ncbi:MAG: hypothetical protein LQ345_005747 [Seirophora villosa]|nr:MAG: hypothetical protein LQ345_005747 [Seirophora villosa]
MQTHNISVSILSLANPWLDFLPPDSAAGWAQKINDELNAISSASRNRIRAFGCLPLSAPTTADSTTEIQRLTTSCPFIRGIIIGTSGLGLGLDDPKLDPVWAALQGCAMPVFVHPHYGLPSEVFGPRMQESGHVLPLSLGFPLETTVAFMRMWLAGVFDRFPALQVLLAHAGGGVPALAGRVQSCVEHERGFFDEGKGKRVGGPRRGLREVLQANVWLDAVGYGEVGLKGAMEVVGKERVLFGTDHPFFPPLGGEENGEWESVRTNLDAVERVFESDREGLEGVLGVNARKFFGIDGEGSDE